MLEDNWWTILLNRPVLPKHDLLRRDSYHQSLSTFLLFRKWILYVKVWINAYFWFSFIIVSLNYQMQLNYQDVSYALVYFPTDKSFHVYSVTDIEGWSKANFEMLMKGDRSGLMKAHFEFVEYTVSRWMLVSLIRRC